MFGRVRRRQAEPPEFPAAWRTMLQQRWPLWTQLSAADRSRLEALTLQLLDQTRFEASKGFELTDEMCALIAAQAALLVLELDVDAFRKVRTVIVHPATMVQTGARRAGSGGLMTDEPSHLDGQAHMSGPILVAWDAVVYDARHPLRGLNVVYHEFAHQLDMLDGVVDGTPPMAEDARAHWAAVCTREYEAVRRGGEHLLRGYAATDLGEFFAVATEMFFSRPAALAAQHAELYEVLAGFYRQDPAGRAASLDPA